MNGKWIDQFPPEREYDLEVDEDTYELQMADSQVAQEAATRAEAAAVIATEKAAIVTEKTDIVTEKAQTAIQKAAEAGRYADSALISVRIAEQIKNETVQAGNSATMAKNDTQTIKEEVEQLIVGLDNFTTAAEASAQAAAVSEASAQTYSSQANNSAQAAAQDAQSANNARAEVEENATKASQSAAASAVSATNAANDASNASQSAENAAASEQAAKTSEQNAAQSKSDAATNATIAMAAKNDAVAAATDASNSALAANTSKTEVQSLKNTVDTTVNNFTSTTVPNAIQQVNAAGSTQITNIQSESSTQISTIESAGETQISNIETKGQEILDAIPDRIVNEVQINGTNIVNNGVANIPCSTQFDYGVVKNNGIYGVWVDPDGFLRTAMVSTADIKAGENTYRTIKPANQHESTFYGLAKAAGADEKNSTLPVGQYTNAAKSAIQTMLNVSDKSEVEALSALPIISPSGVETLLNNGEYTDEAKIALQKALGIYEAPWELIREDTFTNTEEADHVITTDADGQAFELTDYFLYFETPIQDTYSKKGTYGQVWIYYNNITNAVSRPESGGWEQNAGTTSHGFAVYGEQKNGLFLVSFTSQTTLTNRMNWNMRYSRFNDIPSQVQSGVWIVKDFLNTYNLSDTNCFAHRIDIKSVTGTGHYKLYGRRKWQ